MNEKSNDNKNKRKMKNNDKKVQKTKITSFFTVVNNIDPVDIKYKNNNALKTKTDDTVTDNSALRSTKQIINSKYFKFKQIPKNANNSNNSKSNPPISNPNSKKRGAVKEKDAILSISNSTIDDHLRASRPSFYTNKHSHLT